MPLEIFNNFFQTNKINFSNLEIEDFIGFKIDKENLLELLNFVKTSPELRFTILSDLFGADFPSRTKRFEIVYSLLSLKLNKRLLIKIEVDEEESPPSIASIFSAACWYERELFDMFGVVSAGSPDLRRILTDYGFVGHPLRKDFPVSGHLQVRYDDKLQRVIYEPVLLDQEFRMFDFLSPWSGPERSLPGDEKANLEKNK